MQKENEYEIAYIFSQDRIAYLERHPRAQAHEAGGAGENPLLYFHFLR